MLRRVDASLENIIRRVIGQALTNEWEVVPGPVEIAAKNDGPDWGRVAIVIQVRRRERPISRGWLDRK